MRGPMLLVVGAQAIGGAIWGFYHGGGQDLVPSVGITPLAIQGGRKVHIAVVRVPAPPGGWGVVVIVIVVVLRAPPCGGPCSAAGGVH